jgi:chromosome segregation protein
MLLKKLEINGFKSFATKTVLDFSMSNNEDGIRGITAIVGPNGSGKSNIADAMRWVIGEQSMKNLRGKKADDIIFAGSGKKAKLGGAQVSLYFDNSKKIIPLEFEEVVITRKIFRSGESEYLINGSRVRLQDIVDILAKAGVGKESHTIINQGMADAILSATPLERRFVIEEAAGVKQYQIKKERALRKLETTRENLVRVGGLIEEIRPNLRVLKRQAERATQGEAVAKSLKEKQMALYSYLWNKFAQEKINLSEEKNALGIKMMNAQREADKLADETNSQPKEEGSNGKVLELEKKQLEKRNELNELEREMLILSGRIEIEKEKQKSIQIIEEIKIKSQPVDLFYIKDNLKKIRIDQEALIEKINKAESLSDLQKTKELAISIGKRLDELGFDIDKGKKEEKNMQIKPKEADLPKVDLPIVLEFQAKIEKMRQKKCELEKELRKIFDDIQIEAKADRDRRQHFFQLERELRLKQDSLNNLKDKHNEFKVSLAKIEVREEDLRAKILEELKIDVAYLHKEVDAHLDYFNLEREIAKLKFQMEQIGGIDPLVIAEYEEINKRFEFLSKETLDLENAMESLKEVVKEMEERVAEKFHETFDEINKEFSKYFRIIFGGGDAHLIKINVRLRKTKEMTTEDSNREVNDENDKHVQSGEEEKGEIGIDISACPAGKRINNLSILSGGERSLTSLALLFAIIAHNPPPFSILDEVEAALDEANSKRFSGIIRDLSSHTQFIAITHNRETMRQASALYGVTMGDDGVSKLLSVKIDQVGRGGKIVQ